MTPKPAAFPPHRPILIAVIAASAFFMEILDATVIAPAVPQIAESFNTSATAISAGISSYLITVGVFIPASAWMSERFGARAVFAVAIAVFTLASVLCGMSQTLGQFTLARVLQGMGGAMMSPVGRLEVLRRTEKSDLLMAIAYLTWPGLTAFAVGPLLGGFLTTYLSWRWIFYVNVPIGLFGIAMVLTFFERNTGGTHKPFDLRGFLLNGSALGLLILGVETAGHGGRIVLGSIVAAAGLLLGFLALRHGTRHPAPLLSLVPFRMLTFSIGTFSGGGLFRISVGATGFLLPVMFQLAFGLTAFEAGVLVFYFLMGDLAAKAFANTLLRVFGFRPVMVIDGAIVVASGFALILLTPAMPYWLMVAILVASGMVRSIQFSALNSLSFADIPPELMSSASTLGSMLHQINMGFGVTLAALLLNASAGLRAGTGAALTHADFRIALGAMAVLALIATLNYLRLPPDAAADLRGDQ